jgi:hypothetical protein
MTSYRWFSPGRKRRRASLSFDIGQRQHHFAFDIGSCRDSEIQ